MKNSQKKKFVQGGASDAREKLGEGTSPGPWPHFDFFPRIPCRFCSGAVGEPVRRGELAASPFQQKKGRRRERGSKGALSPIYYNE